MKKILIVDDDVAVTNYFMVFLMQTEMFDVTVENDSRNVEGLLAESDFDLMLLDMDMPNISGMEILRRMRARGDDMPVIILTGVSDVDLAVKSMKLDAFDYLVKPVDDDKLLEVIENAVEHDALHQSIEQLPSELSRESLDNEAAFEGLPTQDSKMIRVLHQAEKMAESDLSIFIWGEPGTGKEALARSIHDASPRSDAPFIAVEADSHPPGEVPAFLFGQARVYGGEKQAAPGVLEEAEGGTLFIDKIEALDIPVQVRLKRVIQTDEYYRESSARIRRADVRFIVSSTKDLTQPEYRESFSQDLLFHLMVNPLQIPPLRERPGDIPLLARHFLRREVRRTGRRIEGFDDNFLELLKGYPFPDNMQELRNIIAMAVVNEESDRITLDSLSSYVRSRIDPDAEAGGVYRTMDEVMRDHARLTLQQCKGDRDTAAAVLEIPREELERLLPPERES
jgi:two-component system response regulator HydG